ncbi:hypothetical protein AOC10_06220 [Polynucleobacter asymbioticus]|jgi:hypothetical protein|nr:hypothetical protein AOC10_06220 [Polynucleobacter asymbioticus]
MSVMGLMMEFEPPFVPTMKIKKLKTDKKSLKSTPFLSARQSQLPYALTMIFSRFSPISKT